MAAEQMRAELTLRLQERGMLPHYASKQASSLTSFVPAEDLECAGIDVILRHALNSSTPHMYSPTKDVSSGTVSPAKSHGHFRRSPNVHLKSKKSSNTVVVPSELAWSPERSGRNFSVPPKSVLKPANTGLYNDMAQLANAAGQAADDLAQAAKAKRIATYFDELNVQLAGRKLEAARKEAAYQQSIRDTVDSLRRDTREGQSEWLDKQGELAAVDVSRRTFNEKLAQEKNKAKDDDVALTDMYMKIALDKAAREQAAADAKRAALKDAIRASALENARYMAQKKLAAGKEKAEDARLTALSMATADAVDEQRKAEAAAKLAELNRKLDAAGEVLKSADSRAAADAAKADRDAEKIAREKEQEIAGRAAAVQARKLDNLGYVKIQLAEKAKAAALAALETRRELALKNAEAREEAARLQAKKVSARHEAHALRVALEQQILAGAAKLVRPDGDAVEAAMHGSWIKEQQALVQKASRLPAARRLPS